MYVMIDLNCKKIDGTLSEKELQNKKKKNKLKNYSNSFNSWFDKKETVT